MVISFLGLGTNMGGDLSGNLNQAIEFLSEGGSVLKISSFIETEPVGEVEQDNFLNAVVKFEHEFEPLDLLKFVKSIESKMGRPLPGEKGYIHWGPRIIDIDILTYDDLEIVTQELQIPHPRMHERDFVMIPLREIWDGASNGNI